MTDRITRRAALGSMAALGAGTALLGSGCSRESERLQFWQFYAPQAQQKPDLIAQNDWFLDVIKDWNAENPEQIDPVYIPNYVDPMNPRLATAFAAGTGPDVFLISPGEFLRYYNGGVLVDLKPYMEQAAVDDFYPQAIDTRVIGDSIYALPMEVEPLTVYYDVKAFEEAGLSEGDLPKTWDDMIELAARLTTRQRSGLVLETQPGYYQNFTFYGWAWQGGGDILDVETQQPTITDEAVLRALQLYGDTIKRGIAPRTLPGAGDLVTGFSEGLAAMWHRGPWTIAEMAQQAPDHPFGTFACPVPPGGQPATAAGGWAWAVNNRGRNPDAAARFVVQAIGSMSRDSIDRCADWSGRAKSNLPARKSAAEAMTRLPSASDPHRRVIREDAFPSSRGEPRYPPVLYKAVSNAIQSVQRAGADPLEQAETAQAAVESFLQTYEGGALL